MEYVMNDPIPPIMRMILDNANRPRLAKEDEVANRYVLGTVPFSEYLAARHQNNRK
jgi:hypothetical protein